MFKFHALIVDDNPLNVDILLTLLESQGGAAIAIDTPRKLGETIETMPQVDVIFLDLEFPNNDGFDVLQHLKLDDRLSATSIVAYSVHTSEIAEARRVGFNGFLGKPLDIHRFPEQLTRILGGEEVWEI